MGTDETWTDDAPSAPPPQERSTGLRLLGEGGIGRVFAVHHAQLGREVARKELKEGAGHRALQRFLREARVTAQLEHPGIVPVYSAGVDERGTHFYTMKLVRGRSLAAVLMESPDLDRRLQCVDALAKVVDAMAYAHSRGVIHRDLKPENIMLGEFAEVLVVDWGLARFLGEADPEAAAERRLDLGETNQTMVGTIAGTPAYMGPEQASGGAIGPAADVFGLGAILYEILTGTPPYGRGPAMQTLEKARAHVFEPVRSRSPGAPPPLAAIAERALAPLPDRYPDAAALGADLQDWLHGRRVSTYDYSSRELLARFVRAYRAPLTALGVGLVLTAATGFVGWASTVQQRDEAMRARAEAEASLATSLQARAEASGDDGLALEAAAMAAHALQIREDPVSRGLLMSYLHTPLPRPEWARQVPCTSLAVAADSLLCGSPQAVHAFTVGGAERWSVPAPHRISEIGPDRVAVRDASNVLELSLDDGSELARHDGAHFLHYRPDGTRWVFRRSKIEVLHPDGARDERPGPGSLVVAALERPDGVYVVTVASRIWRYMPDSHELLRVSENIVYGAVDLGDAVVVAGNGVALWRADAGDRWLSRDPATGAAVAGDVLAVAAAQGGVTLWDTRGSRVLGRLPNDEGPASVTMLGPRQVVVGGRKTLRMWELGEGIGGTLHLPSNAASYAVSPGGERLFSCGFDGTLTMVDLPTLSVVWEVETGRRVPLAACGWRDGEHVVVLPEPSDGGLRAAEDGRAVAQLGFPTARVPPGLVAGERVYEQEGTATYDLHGQVLAETGGAMLPTRAGRLVMQRRGRLPDDVSGSVLEDLEGHLADLGTRTYLAGSDEGMVLRSTDDGRVLCRLGRTSGPAVFWGDHIATGSFDGSLVVWRRPGAGGSDCERVAEVTGSGHRIADLFPTDDVLVSLGWDGDLHSYSLGGLRADPARVTEQLRSRHRIDVRGGEITYVGDATNPGG